MNRRRASGLRVGGLRARGMRARGMRARGMRARGMRARGMRARGVGGAVCAALLSLTVAGCTAATDATKSSTSGSQVQIGIGVIRPQPQLSGIVAVGHSGLTGYDTLQDGWGGLANSWATGNNPAVRSVVSRLDAAFPKLTGRVANFAAPGATAAMLDRQSIDAMTEQSRPALIIVQILGNDIHCDGTDPANYARVGTDVRDSLDTMHAFSKTTPILVVGALGSPIQQASALVGDHAAVAAHRSGNCALFTRAGRIDYAGIKLLDSVTAGYWNQITHACKAVPGCVTDDGAAARLTLGASDLLHSDWKHLSVRGQNRLAAAIWPRAQRLLG